MAYDYYQRGKEPAARPASAAHDMHYQPYVWIWPHAGEFEYLITAPEDMDILPKRTNRWGR